MHHHHHHTHHGEGDPRWARNWRRLEAMARRGFGRMPGMTGKGDWGFGDNFRIGRTLASGDLRLVALYLIEQQPRHGYDLIKAVEEQSRGFYSPSPGIVYPALTFLEEAGYVTSETEGNKKLYTITDEGRTHLADNREAIQATLDFLGKAGEKLSAWRDMQAAEGSEDAEDGGFRGRGFRRQPPEPPVPPVPPQPPFRRHGHSPDRDMRDVVPELNEARRALKSAIAETVATGETAQRRIADILQQAARDIRAAGSAAEADDIDL